MSHVRTEQLVSQVAQAPVELLEAGFDLLGQKMSSGAQRANVVSKYEIRFDNERISYTLKLNPEKKELEWSNRWDSDYTSSRKKIMRETEENFNSCVVLAAIAAIQKQQGLPAEIKVSNGEVRLVAGVA